MVSIIKNYLLDFWLWWYWFNLKRVLTELTAEWSFALNYLNLLPMAGNLFSPLFKDSSFEGRLVAFPIRLTWVLVGSLLLLLYTVLLVSGLICYLVIPLLPIVVLINSFMVKG